MALPAFDTLAYVKKLVAVGISPKQAEAQAELQSEILSELLTDKLATKEDIKDIHTSIIQLETVLTTKIEQVEARSDAKTDQLDAKLTTKIEQVEARLDAKIDQLDAKIEQVKVEFRGKFNIIYWMMAFQLALSSGILLKILH